MEKERTHLFALKKRRKKRSKIFAGAHFFSFMTKKKNEKKNRTHNLNTQFLENLSESFWNMALPRRCKQFLLARNRVPSIVSTYLTSSKIRMYREKKGRNKRKRAFV